jgi:HEAT repeat protein
MARAADNKWGSKKHVKKGDADRHLTYNETRKLVGSRNVQDRIWVAGLIGIRRQKRWLAHIAKLSRDKSPEVRSTAVWAAGSIGTPLGRAIVNRALKDPDVQVKRTAISMATGHVRKKAGI